MFFMSGQQKKMNETDLLTKKTFSIQHYFMKSMAFLQIYL